MPTLYNPQIIISAAPGITQYLRLALYEALSPTVEVASSGQLAPPHNSSRQLVFYNLRPVIHLASLYITNGVDTLGTLIANFELDPRYPGVEVKADWHIYADETPGFDSGTNVFTDPTAELYGWSYSVEIRGNGTLDPDPAKTELHQLTEGYEVPQLDDSGPYVFQPGEHHVIKFAPKIIAFTPEGDSGGNLITGVKVITEDYIVPPAAIGTMHLLQSLTSTLVITLPDITLAAANKIFLFSSQGGEHVNAVIQVEGSNNETIDWLREPMEQLILGQSEQLQLFKFQDEDDPAIVQWKVVNDCEGIKHVGEKVYSDKFEDDDLLNCIYADGRLLDREVYPRLWAYVQTLSPDQIVSELQWSIGVGNRGRYTQGTDSTNFRIPDYTVTGFFRGIDFAARQANSYEVEMVGPHNHNYKRPRTDIIGEQYEANHIEENNDRGLWTGDTVETEDNSGTENRPANVAQYILIRI